MESQKLKTLSYGIRL